MIWLGSFGKSVAENPARDLQAGFPGRNGYSVQNLWLMRQFFNEYVNLPNLQSLIGEISRAKNLLTTSGWKAKPAHRYCRAGLR